MRLTPFYYPLFTTRGETGVERSEAFLPDQTEQFFPAVDLGTDLKPVELHLTHNRRIIAVQIDCVFRRSQQHVRAQVSRMLSQPPNLGRRVLVMILVLVASQWFDIQPPQRFPESLRVTQSTERDDASVFKQIQFKFDPGGIAPIRRDRPRMEDRRRGVI